MCVHMMLLTAFCFVYDNQYAEYLICVVLVVIMTHIYAKIYLHIVHFVHYIFVLCKIYILYVMLQHFLLRFWTNGSV